VALWAPAAGTAIIAAATQIQPPGKDRDPAMTPPRSIRGAFLDLVNDPFLADAQECVRFVPDGLLVVEDGMIRDFGRYADLAAKYPGLPVTAFPDRLIVPGLIDCHIHYPQSRVIAAFGNQLLEWLTASVFPEERKFRDATYARGV